MFPQKRQINAEIKPKTYPLGEQIERLDRGSALGLVALSHTPVERRLYSAMLGSLQSSLQLTATDDFPKKSAEVFTVRRVMEVTGIANLSTVRRGLEGLVTKCSLERLTKSTETPDLNESSGNGKTTAGNGGDAGGSGRAARENGVAYRVLQPEEVIARRDQTGIHDFARGLNAKVDSRSLDRVIQRIVEARSLSRREAQVALCCVEGLTNAEIGARLLIKEQTVKFHLRHVFLKLRVKRRAELISRLLL